MIDFTRANMREEKGSKISHIVSSSIIILVLLSSSLMLQPVNAQGQPNGGVNSPGPTSTNSNTTSAVPSAATNTAGGGTSSGSLNMSHFTNAANLVINGKTFPIKYNITGGKLLGLVADNDKTTVVAVISPGGSGKMVLTLELPRNVIDSKGQGNTDTKFLVKIDGKGVDYKEVANNLNARILGIDFSKDNRIIEISGTQMTP
jgi:hypothetical protein